MPRKEIDFDDEDAVLAEMARELDIPVEDLKIREARGASSFGVGTFYEVSERGAKYGKEWIVARDDDAARELALASVKQDLEQEPENFDQSFLESHIDLDRLRRDLHSDIADMAREDAEDTARRNPERFWQDAEGFGIDPPEPPKTKQGRRQKVRQVLAEETPEPTDDDIERFAEAVAEDRLKDPLEYLRDIYGNDDAVKKAIEIAGIDEDAAAEEAVSADGAGHFLSSYDGNTYDTANGLTYWRTN
jgi:hypothetical protein